MKDPNDFMLVESEGEQIKRLTAELAVEKMAHSVTIADEHESRTEFQDRTRALEAELAEWKIAAHSRIDLICERDNAELAAKQNKELAEHHYARTRALEAFLIKIRKGYNPCTLFEEIDAVLTAETPICPCGAFEMDGKILHSAKCAAGSAAETATEAHARLQLEQGIRSGSANPQQETMRITYELKGRCLWHEDCDKSRSGIVFEELREKDRTLVRCRHCGRSGYFPVGATSVCVAVEYRQEMETFAEQKKLTPIGKPNKFEPLGEGTICSNCTKTIGYHYQTAEGNLFCEAPKETKGESSANG
jgi:hypothetical protein